MVKWIRCIPHPGIFSAVFMQASLAFAVPIPPEGEILRSLPQVPDLTRSSPELRFEAESLDDLEAGGDVVTLKGFVFEGNSVFSDDDLIKILGDVFGIEYDLAGLRQLANQLSEFYREAGYSFAKVYLPKQDVSSGIIELIVLEGTYGRIQAVGEPELRALVESYLSELTPGSVIDGHQLESIVLTLGDVPGIRVAPVLKPGRQVGQGDLDVQVRRDEQSHGYLTLDNQGSRFSGENRMSAGITIPTFFGVGHEFDFNVTRSNEDLKVVGVGYGWPIGDGGGRFKMDYSYVSYALTNSNDLEGIKGWSKIYRGNFVHPLIRSQTGNLWLEYGAQLRKAFAINGTQTSGDGNFRTFPLRLRFDSLDVFAGGGSWRGSLVYTKGDIDDYQNDVYESWDKLAVDLTRIQSVGNHVSLMWRLAGQGGEKPIRDSSEQMSLGGVQGVRAYPSGEGSFTRAYVTQLEMRFTRDGYAPYIFVDHANGFRHGSDEATSREIGGYGLGIRTSVESWSIDGFWSRKRNSQVSSADPEHGNLIFQVSIQKQF